MVINHVFFSGLATMKVTIIQNFTEVLNCLYMYVKESYLKLNSVIGFAFFVIVTIGWLTYEAKMK